MLDDLGLWTFRCENCEQNYKAHPEANAWCGKCFRGHSLCGACWELHRMPVTEEAEYLKKLGAEGS